MIPLGDEDRLLLIPGPTPVHREILEALGRPTISHTSQEIAEIMGRALGRLNTIADNHCGKVFVVAGTGTLAQEIALLNFVDPDESLVVASNGYFATRLHDIAIQHGLHSALVNATPGSSLSPDEVGRAASDASATVVAFTHVETSTGVMAPLGEYIDAIRTVGAMAIVDGVAAFAGVPEPMERLGIDVLLTGAQKALGMPPGLAIVFASERAWEKRVSRQSRLPAYYADLLRWAPIMEQPDKYFSTHPVNLIYALERATGIVMDEGLEQRFGRHERLANRFRDCVTQLGFQLFTDQRYLAPTMSAVSTPETVKASTFRQGLYEHGVVAALGLNDESDRVLRFGHMGNISDGEIDIAIGAIEQVLAQPSS